MTVWAQLQSVGKPEWILKFDTQKRSSFSIGRHPSCSLVLSDMHISSKHLSISQRVSPEGLREVIVEDSSSNGTWIDGEKLERGSPVRLFNGSEITLPCEDVDRWSYSFMFSILHNPNEPTDNSEESEGITMASSPLNSDEASYAQKEQQHSSEQWQKLEKLEELLTLETSRLAASVYTTDKTVDSLGSLVNRFHTQVEESGRNDVLDVVQGVRETHDNLLTLLQEMLASIRKAGDLVNKHETLPSQDKDEIIRALNVENYQAAIATLLPDDPL